MSQINDEFGRPLYEAMRGTPPPSWEQTCLKLSEEKRELQSDVNELKELVEYLQDRIRKLKKAGDDLDSWLGRETPVTVRINWRQVKEGKQ